MTDPDDARDDDVPLVDPSQRMRDQSIQMLMLLSNRFPNAVTYRYPLDMSSEQSVENVKSELGPAAVMPDDPNGLYYFVYITDRAGNRLPILIPEGEVRFAMLAIAVREDAVWARTIAWYPWLLP